MPHPYFSLAMMSRSVTSWVARQVPLKYLSIKRLGFGIQAKFSFDFFRLLWRP